MTDTVVRMKKAGIPILLTPMMLEEELQGQQGAFKLVEPSGRDRPNMFASKLDTLWSWTTRNFRLIPEIWWSTAFLSVPSKSILLAPYPHQWSSHRILLHEGMCGRNNKLLDGSRVGPGVTRCRLVRRLVRPCKEEWKMRLRPLSWTYCENLRQMA